MVIDILTVSISQNDTTICEGDSLVLFSNASQTYSPGSNNSQLSGTLNNGLVVIILLTETQMTKWKWK